MIKDAETIVVRESSDIEALIDGGNYLAAYLKIKNLPEDDPKKDELAGRVVMKIVEDLGNAQKKDAEEKVFYLRSLLIWIFKDVPGLSLIYRDQLKSSRKSSQPVLDFFNTLKEIGERPLQPQDVAQKIEETVLNIKQNIDDAAQRLNNDEVREQVRDLFTLAETGVREGLKQVSDIIDMIAKNQRNSKDEEK
ncbi:MAG: hypothetical protein AB1798_10515 [Spirochaetota bacterium]